MKSRILIIGNALAIAFPIAVLSVFQSAHAVVKTWDGDTGDAMGTPSNWGGNTAPVSGDSWVFGSTNVSADYNLNNDLTTPSTFAVLGITFNSGSPSYVVGDGTSTSGSVGNSFTLTGDVTNSSTSLQTILNPFSMTATRRLFTTAGGGNITIGGNISGTNGAFRTGNGGTATLAGNNTFTGGVIVDASTLAIAHDNALGTGTLIFAGTSGSIQAASGARVIANSVAFNVNGTIGGSNDLTLNGSVTIGATRTLAVSNSGNTILAGAITSTGGAISKSNTGTLTLGNVTGNTYISGTTVSGGTLLVNNSTGSGTGTGAVAINSGGTLGGSGVIEATSTSNVTLASGAKLSPGASAGTAGKLSVASAGTTGFDISGAAGGANTGALLFDLGASTATSDNVLLGSTTAFTIGTGVLNFDDFTFTTLAGFPTTLATYTLFDGNTTDLSGKLGTSLTGLIDGRTATIGLDGTNRDIILTVAATAAVPEPASLAVLGLGGLALLRRRRAPASSSL